MKILIISNLYPPQYIGGYELICRMVVEGLRCRGHEVHILTSNYGVKQETTNQFEPGIERSLHIHGMFGFPWLPIQKLRKLEYHNNSILRQKIARLNPDIIFCFNMGGLSKSLLFTMERTKIPTALYISDHWLARSVKADVWTGWWNRDDAGLFHKLVRGALKVTGVRSRIDSQAPTALMPTWHFDHLYFCSDALKRFTQAAGFDVSKASIIPAPVNIEKFSGPVRPASEPITKLLFVGRITADKGIMTAARAMALLKNKFVGKLCVYGRGDQEEELKQFIAKEKVPIEINTTTDAKEMPNVYRNHDALLFTSEWEEPFALTPLEAMASGLPVIGTTTGGSAELFRHKDNSLTYKAGNAEDLAQQILLLANDPVLREKIALRGQQEVRELYSEPVIVDRVEAFLFESIGKLEPDAPVYAH